MNGHAGEEFVRISPVAVVDEIGTPFSDSDLQTIKINQVVLAIQNHESHGSYFSFAFGLLFKHLRGTGRNVGRWPDGLILGEALKPYDAASNLAFPQQRASRAR